MIKKWILSLVALCTLIVSLSAISAGLPTSGPTCFGRFPNPVTDLCWECMFPIEIGGIPVVQSDKPDPDGPDFPICQCPMPIPPFIRFGIPIAFWEPVRLVDVTRTPGCFVGLGGEQIPLGIGGLGQGDRPDADEHEVTKYQAHWYIYPVTYLLSMIVDTVCLETQGFDLAYMTEVDPLWQDDELTFLLNPEAVVFNNPIAISACAADCAAATAGLPLDPLFWCLGCRGTAYPMNGSIDEQRGGVQASLNIVERLAYKLHRQGILWGSVGDKGLCGSYPMPIMRKSQYRSQLIYPIPGTTGPFCCNPFGRSSALYEMGKEFPVAGEHFNWLIWRKRNCCAL